MANVYRLYIIVNQAGALDPRGGMEAALVLKENSQQPWKTVEERAVSNAGDNKDKAQSAAGAKAKQASETKLASRTLKASFFSDDVQLQ